MKYCNKCLLPDTKPNLTFDKGGICNACTNFDNRKEINWEERNRELEAILNKYRSKDGSTWDCIVPVSGGKDSTYQVIKMLEMNMNPLCVTATTCDLSEIGRKNIENIKSMGVDYVEITTNRRIRARLNKIGLTEVGDISWPEHAGIFTIPIRAAINFNIPLIIWGENSQNEYGGPAGSADNNILDRSWLEKFGGLLGLGSEELINYHGISKKELLFFNYPSDEELKKVGVTGLFLGHYIPWDGLSNAMISLNNGFVTYGKIVEGSAVDYENIDNYQTGIHDYFKYLKYGFGRATDIVSIYIRKGRLTREEGLQMVKNQDGKFPWSYLGKSLEDILRVIDMDINEFIQICDKYTNKNIFCVDEAGNLIKDRLGNLTKKNYDNV